MESIERTEKLYHGAFAALKLEHEKLTKAKLAYEKEDDQLKAFKKKLDNCIEASTDKVKLDIGGRIFATTSATLSKEPSMLSSMFSGHFDMEPDEDGCYFIDRNPDFFPIILDYLRKGTIHLEEIEESQMADFADEVEYYQLESLARLIRDLRQKEKKSAAFYWEVDSSSLLDVSNMNTRVTGMSLSYQIVLGNRGFSEGRHQWGVRVIHPGTHVSVGIAKSSINLTQGTIGLGKDGWGVNGDGLLTHAGVAQEPLRNNIDSDLDDSDSDASGLCRGQKAEEKNIIEPFREGDLIWVDLDMTRRQVIFSNGSTRWPPLAVNCSEVFPAVMLYGTAAVQLEF